MEDNLWVNILKIDIKYIMKLNFEKKLHSRERKKNQILLHLN